MYKDPKIVSLLKGVPDQDDTKAPRLKEGIRREPIYRKDACVVLNVISVI